MRSFWIQKTMKAKLNYEYHHHHHHDIAIMREIFWEDFTKCQGPFIGHRAIQRVVNADNLWSVYRPLTSFLARWFSHTFLLTTIWRMMMIILMIIVMMIKMMVRIVYIHLIAAPHHSISVTRFIPWIFTVKRSSFLKSLWISAHCTSQKNQAIWLVISKPLSLDHYIFIMIFALKHLFHVPWMCYSRVIIENRVLERIITSSRRLLL